jgi:hypothetical protein
MVVEVAFSRSEKETTSEITLTTGSRGKTTLGRHELFLQAVCVRWANSVFPSGAHEGCSSW